MSDYKESDRILDTRNFHESQFGKEKLEIMESKITGILSELRDITHPYPDRVAAKLSAWEEAKELFALLDDDKPSRG